MVAGPSGDQHLPCVRRDAGHDRVVALVTGILLWLLLMIAKGRNWARITYLVLFLVGLPFSILLRARSFAGYPSSASLGFVQIVIQAVALFLLFGADAKRWFSVPPAPPPVPM